ncbi:hypothetical protein MKW98_018473 [Papaver atlanticum]|uniref:Uncharacterized protein n=1 Tax=Papaver atlanticum TaxID=357466 RepID=A0AAD4TDK2_9MAGN|nr:hypothetical protein MKW98_018473 [Papaver atlanticum]
MNRQKETTFERVPTSKDVWTILDHRNGFDEYHFVDKYRATYAGMVGPMDSVCKWKSLDEIEHKVKPPPYER